MVSVQDICFRIGSFFHCHEGFGEGVVMFLPSIYDFWWYFLFETHNKQLFFYLVILPSNSHHQHDIFSLGS